jgi:hypothetical protein
MEIEKADTRLVEHHDLYDLGAACTQIVPKFYHDGRSPFLWGKEYGGMGCISI